MQLTKKINWLTLLTFVLLGIYIARVNSPASSTDTWWHMSIGRQVAQEKKIPSEDKFVYGSADTHYTSTEWLAGLIFYGFVKYLGLNGLLILRVLLGLLSLYLLYRTLMIITPNTLITNTSITLVGYILALRLNDRPEMFSFLFLALVNYVCFYYYLKNKLPATGYLLPVTFLVWPNLHGFSPIGLALLTSWTALFLFDRPSSQKKPSLKTFILLWLLSIIASVAQLPRFLSFITVKKFTQANISEWITLKQRVLLTKGFDFFGQLSLEIYIYLAILIIYLISLLIFFRKFPHQKLDLAVFIFYFLILLLPFAAYRLIPLTLLLTVPFLIQLAVTIPKAVDKTASLSKITFPILILAITSSILTKHHFGLKDFAVVHYEISGQNSQPQPAGVVYRSWLPLFPTAAPKIIKDNLETRRIFSTNFWNNYFIWQSPEAKVFSDAMYEYRSQEDISEEVKINIGDEGFEKLLEKHGIDTVINTQPYNIITPSQVPIYKLANWRLVYIDDIAAIYARKDIIKSTPIDLSAIEPELGTPIKFKHCHGQIN